jgi:hypothetical protein
MLTITEEILDSADFEWYSGEVYSWYKISSQGLFFGQGDKIALAYLPAIYFPEYVEVYGSKPLDVVSNYINYAPLLSAKDSDASAVLRQVFRDLKYLVESNAYLPFTRTGSITIKGGDRRLKRGTMVYYKPTDEVFYIDSVTQSSVVGDSLDRTTSIQVSRGMRKSFVEGVFINGVKTSYFDIVNTQIDESFTISSNNNTQEDFATIFTRVFSNFKVNKDVFDFFIQRRQFMS